MFETLHRAAMVLLLVAAILRRQISKDAWCGQSTCFQFRVNICALNDLTKNKVDYTRFNIILQANYFSNYC